jgi:hypothetical protein
MQEIHAKLEKIVNKSSLYEQFYKTIAFEIRVYPVNVAFKEYFLVAFHLALWAGKSPAPFG